MRLFVAVSCLLAAVAATPLFGTEQCAGGPGVWCVNIRTAAQCGAVKHCQQTVWNKPMVNSGPCEICKKIVTVVKNFVSDNATQSEIESYLNKACEFIPDPDITAECKELVDNYFPLLVNIIVEELDNPAVACCAIGLCKNLQQHLASLKQPQQLLTNEIPEDDLPKMVYPFLANVPLLLYPQEKATPEPKNADVCKDCLQLVSDIQENVKSNSSFSKALIENFIKECDQLGGSMSDLCKTYVNQYAPLVFQMLIQVPAQQICCGAGLCPQKKSAPLEMTPAKSLVPAVKLQPAVKVSENPVNVSPTCEICQLAMQELETLLDNNRTRENIKGALEKVCYIVPSKYREQCKDLIDAYSDTIITLLEQEISPKDICMSIGCCSVNQPRIVKISTENAQSGQYCPVCKLIVNYVDEIVQKNATQNKIKTALQMVCNFLPQNMQDECRALVLEYEPMFIELLLQVMDPSFVCMKLQLCSNQKPILGAEKCMWGPSYWCQSLETAGNCNAIEHCKRHVWN